MRRLLWVMLISISSIASAHTPVPPPKIQSGIGAESCVAAVNAANSKCFAGGQAVEMKGVEMGLDGAAAQGSKTVPNQASNGEGFSQLGVGTGTIGAEMCSDANNACQKGCGQALTSLKSEKLACDAPDGKYKSLNAMVCSNVDSDIHQVEATLGECQMQLLGKGRDYLVQAGASAEAMGKYLKTGLAATGETAADKAGDFLANNYGKIGLGILGVAAIHNLTKGGGGGDGGGGAGGAGANGGAPDCTKDDAAKNLLCDGQLIQECSALGKVASAKCNAFTDRYCGFATATDQVNTAPGLGSQLCKDAMAGKYCKAEAKAKCYSCLNMKDRQADRCVQSPASCLHQNTDQEMGYFKSACPDDPVFLDQKYAHINAIPLPFNTPLPTNTIGQATNPVGQPPVGQPPATNATPSSTARIPSNVNGDVAKTTATDTSPKFGVSVFSLKPNGSASLRARNVEQLRRPQIRQ